MQALARPQVALSRPVASAAAQRKPGSLSAPRPSGLSQTAPRRGDLLTARVFGGPKKTLKREEEPEEYWSSAAERRGESPFKDPLAIIGLLAIFFPFVLLGIAIALGWVDLAGGR